MTDEFHDPCADGICRERLCGRMKRELSSFSFLEDADLDEIAGYFECRQVKAGETLWREGDACSFVAFVVQGRLEVKKQTEFVGKEVVVGVYGVGTVVGEICFFGGSRRAETAQALERLDLILLTRKSYERLVEAHPVLGVRLLEGMLFTVSTRLRKSFERLAAIF
jgi:CRP-like cAMP-binding protein